MENIALGLGLSLHLGFGSDYNSIHPYGEYQFGNGRIGAYYNSENNISTYGGVNIPVIKDRVSVDTGLVGGYDLNYDNDESSILERVSPYLKFNYHVNEDTTLFASPGAELNSNNETEYGVVTGLTFSF